MSADEPAVAPPGSFTISPPGCIEFGAGAVQALGTAVASLGKRSAFVVTDAGLVRAGIVDVVQQVLARAGIVVDVFDDVEPNPSLDTVDRAGERARWFGDAAVVAVGGGSCLDAAKGIALAAVNTGSAADLDVAGAVAALPVVAVPTTAGTGAETNGFGVIEDSAAHCKVYVGDASVCPRVSILDPELTIGLPPAATAATGVDALVHAVESLTSLGRNPVSEAYAHQAVRLVGRWLPVAVADGGNREARAQMLIGSHLAGLALSQSGLGVVHGIAHAVTAHTGAVHGVALAAVLERALEFNLPASTDAYAAIAFDLGVGRTDADPGRNARAAIAACRDLTDRTSVRTSLTALGCTPALVPDLARTALADPVTRNTPRMPSDAELRELLTASL